MSHIAIPQTTLKRDMASMGLVETDRSKAEEYRVRSKMLNASRQAKEEINNIKQKLTVIDELQEDMREIKALLVKLVKE